MKYETEALKIDWEGTIKEVVEKINILRECWKATEEGNKELHEKMVQDIYFPTITMLAQFCSSVEIHKEKNK